MKSSGLCYKSCALHLLDLQELLMCWYRKHDTGIRGAHIESELAYASDDGAQSSCRLLAAAVRRPEVHGLRHNCGVPQRYMHLQTPHALLSETKQYVLGLTIMSQLLILV